MKHRNENRQRQSTTTVRRRLLGGGARWLWRWKVFAVAAGCCIWFSIQLSLWNLLIIHRDETAVNDWINPNPAVQSLPPSRQHAKKRVDEPIALNNNSGSSHSNRATKDANIHNGNDDDKENGTHNDDNDDFHIVFSTDCSGYQHWQGIFLWYSAVRVKQPGTITRIASGCDEEQQATILQEWKRIDPTGNKFRVHFAPATTLKESSSSSYKYSNKPGGLWHWLQHNQQQQQQQNGAETSSHSSRIRLNNNTVVCLLDPDMILLRPITADLIGNGWIRRSQGRKQVEYVDPVQQRPQLLRMITVDDASTTPTTADVPPSPPPQRIITGHPAGQHFGIGGAWAQAGQPHARPVWQNFSKSIVCGDDGPCTRTSQHDASRDYAVGPVYLATVHDWNRIAPMWWDFCPRVHDQYPHLLAEMYSLTMAVANLQMRFHLFSSYMVTGADVTSPTEAWTWIDEYINNKTGIDNNNNAGNNVAVSNIVENKAHQATDTTTTTKSWIHRMCPRLADGNEYNNNLLDDKFPIPNTLHYCQRYKLDLNHGGEDQSFLFAKRKIPHDVFSCDTTTTTEYNKNKNAWMIPFDMDNLTRAASSAKRGSATAWTTTERRTLFAHCQLVPLLNWARRRYHEQVCVPVAVNT